MTVLGGEALGSSLSSIGGGLVVYDGRLRYMIEDGEVSLYHDRQNHRAERLGSPAGEGDLHHRWGPKVQSGRGSSPLIRPVIETAGPNSLHLEALGIRRTETDLADELGYGLRLQQFVGGRWDFSVGASAFSQVNPIESWRLTDSENSLTTLLLHRDYRDYYERTGWLGFVTAGYPELPCTYGSSTLMRNTGMHPSGVHGLCRKMGSSGDPSPSSERGGSNPWRAR